MSDARGELDLGEFAEEVGADDPVTVAGLATRGGPVEGVRPVMAPVGIVSFTPDEMTVRCGAGTPMEELDEALAAHGQTLAIPPSGTIGGALALPTSKSHSIRALLFGLLANGTSTIHGLLDSPDIRATAAACSALGAQVELGEDTTITGVGGRIRSP